MVCMVCFWMLAAWNGMVINFSLLPNFATDCSRHCVCMLDRWGFCFVLFCFVLWGGVFLLFFLGVLEFSVRPACIWHVDIRGGAF